MGDIFEIPSHVCPQEEAHVSELNPQIHFLSHPVSDRMGVYDSQLES